MKIQRYDFMYLSKYVNILVAEEFCYDYEFVNFF